MKRKNMATMVTCIALVGAVAVGGTLALLSQQSNDVRNTFTVGAGYDTEDPDLTLDESPVKQVTTIEETNGGMHKIGDYIVNTGNRTEGNQYANLVEGAFLAKDPQFHIASDCQVETSWIVAKVDGFNTGNNVTTLKFTDVDDTDRDNSAVSGTWYKVTKDKETGTYSYTEVSLSNMGNGVYIYNTGLKKGQSTEDLFQQLQVDKFVPGQNPTEIVVEGYAVEGVANVSFDNMKDDVMKTVDTWAFGSTTEPGTDVAG